MSTADRQRATLGPEDSTELPDWNASTGPAVDSVIEESRLADASAPDGGYGWVVVGCASILTFWFVGTTYSWGVIQEALIRSTPGNAAVLPWVGSLTVACIAFFALINARVVRAIGPRKLGMIGVALMSGGQVFSGFALNSVGALFVTEGLIMGYGVSCCFMVSCGLFDHRSGRNKINTMRLGGFCNARTVLQQAPWSGKWACLCRWWYRRSCHKSCNGSRDGETRACMDILDYRFDELRDWYASGVFHHRENANA